MQQLNLDIQPYLNDPGHWGASLATLAEVMIPCLDAIPARSVVEVGAYAGDLTGLLLQWAAHSKARIVAIDPVPQEELTQLAEDHPELDLIAETSVNALGNIPRPDAVVIDGDHNYWTVSEELRLIGEHGSGADLPLLFFHDVTWPHARRDDYYDPTLIPAEYRQPIEEGAGLFPGVPGVRPGGLPYRWPAAREGGPRNGVLTAVEDFVEATDGLQLAVVPAFFGLGVVWHRDAPWGDAVSQIVSGWDGNPLLERLEANRVAHLATSHRQTVKLSRAEDRIARQEVVIRRLLESSAFSVAERLSRLRLRAGIGKEHAQVSKEDLRRALEDDRVLEG